MSYLSFWGWFVSLNVMISSFISFPTNHFVLLEIKLHCAHRPHFPPLSISEHPGWFCILAVVYTASITEIYGYSYSKLTNWPFFEGGCYILKSDHTLVLFFSYGRTSLMIATVPDKFTFSPSLRPLSPPTPPFTHVLANLCCFRFLVVMLVLNSRNAQPSM